MSKLEKTTLVVGPFQCNCSILVCKNTREAIVVDPGDQFDKIEGRLKQLGVKLKYAVHTHAHLDHIGAVGELKAARPEMKITLHQADEWMYKNLPMQGKLFGFEYLEPPAVDKFLSDGEALKFGESEFEVVHTPGHSPGGICLRFKEGELGSAPEVFTGDTLFQHSVGRTDLWGGDHKQMIKSIKDRLLTLDEETLVHPGHGPSSTIAEESRANPFL